MHMKKKQGQDAANPTEAYIPRNKLQEPIIDWTFCIALLMYLEISLISEHAVSYFSESRKLDHLSHLNNIVVKLISLYCTNEVT